MSESKSSSRNVLDGALPESTPLFHWSPSTRHAGIVRFGLCPGKLATDKLWRPPYVAFCDSPSLAWALSGMTERGAEHPRWDLWMVWSDRVAGEVLEQWDGSGRMAEFRVYERIFKRDVWYVGSRDRAT